MKTITTLEKVIELLTMIPDQYFDQDNHTSKSNPLCGCILHHISEVEGYRIGYVEAERQFDLTSTELYFLFGKKTAVKQRAQLLMYDKPLTYDVECAISRVNFIIETRVNEALFMELERLDIKVEL